MDLGAIDEPVPFDFGVAEKFVSSCRSAELAIELQSSERSSWVHTGLTDFQGHFSDLFRTNGSTAAIDASNLRAACRGLASKVRYLSDEARKEQERRDVARAWKTEHDARNDAQKALDWLTGGDDPPVGPPATPAPQSATAPAPKPRQTPPPASGGSGSVGSGTSSARPSNLRTFATSSQSANDLLRPNAASLRSGYGDFQALCHWGTLDADGVLNAYAQWLDANDQDVVWATAVANAFARAGGEGQVSTLSNSAITASLRSAHVHASRQELAIESVQVQGGPATSGYADDPVNVATGNFLEPETDLTFPGAAATLSLGRCYNSSDRGVHAFGPGWSSICDAGLMFDAMTGLARLTLPDGREVHFPRLGDGWDRAVGESLWLDRETASDDLVVTGNDGSWWRLTSAGTLTSYGTGPVGSRAFVELERDAAGRVVRLVHARGQWIGLAWSAGRVVEARSADGRAVAYAYDLDARLLSATGPSGARTYRWNAAGLVAAVVDADGVVEVDNGYDDRGRVVAQRSAFGRTTRYVYLPGRVTVVSDEDGMRSNTWISDERGRLVGVVDADEQRQSTSYDRWGNPVVLTERDGATTVHEYDARGRKVRTVTPSGADLTFGYDHRDRVTTVVTEQGAVTGYAYDGDQRNPSTIVDPEGGTTRLDWRHGLLVGTTDPTGVTVGFSYDEHRDLIGVTNAGGATAQLERDKLGRVTAAITPSGHRTTYTWDPASGQLAERTNADGGTWRYEYTTAGRLTATTDPLGARTSVAYGEHGEERATVDPLGRSVTRRFDDLGNLAEVTLPDGSRWSFAHDALSRLTATTDPNGGTWRQEYDRAGHPLASVDPSEVRVGVDLDRPNGQVEVGGEDGSATTEFDPLGRLTSLGQADGSAAICTYDRCGRPVEALDADGGLTVIRRDAAGRPVEVVSPLGHATRYGYDACGRVVTVTDALGAVTTIGYDVDSRPVTQTLPTGEVARSVYDVCGRIVEHRAPGVGTSRWTYDLAGQVVAWRDPNSGTRTFRYDAAGQMTAVTDGNGGVTTFFYDANGRTTEITNPLGGVTRRKFDAMNRCVAETDPIGRTTRAGYDAAGRLAWQESPDGRRMTWTYDAAGRPKTMAVDGRTVTALTRDLRRRTVRITDTTDEKGRVVEHELEWDRRQQLVRRARDGRAVTWTYDADGRRTSMTTPDGTTATYGWDAAGRLAWVDNDAVGRAAFDRDAAGRIVSALAGRLIQSWTHVDGFVVAHTMTDGDGSTRTTIDRDGDGRISRVVKGGGGASTATEYAYDGACQLVEARIRMSAGTSTITSTNRWRYDAAGRLVAESTDAGAEQHIYDAAGQLLSTFDAEGRATLYTYDGSGRRTSAHDNRGQTREFLWNPTGYLAGVVHRDRDRVTKTTVRADALGELSSVDGTQFFWDTAAYAGAPVLAGDTPILSAGPVTGVGRDWTAPGWRTARSTDADPWTTSGSTSLGGSGAVQIDPTGGISIDGLDWMGARVYDPAARGFLSVDPADGLAGMWANNPYAYAANDPIHATDPRGLNPVTDRDLQAYRDNNGITGTLNNLHAIGAAGLQAAGKWWGNNWEYVAGGAMVVAGGVLMATGVGGPAGAMLISAGADTIIQKAATGHVDWKEVAISGAAGAIGGGAVAARIGVTGLRAAVVSGAVSGAAGGASMGAYRYGSGPGPHTAGGFLSATAVGGVEGAALGGAGGAAGHGLTAVGGKLICKVFNTGCFVAGTEVLLADGTSKAIEDVETDDEVMAYNPETDQNEPRRVVRAFVHQDKPTYDVVIEDESKVTTTSEHPFMVEGRGWTPVDQLEKGDLLVRPDGSTVSVLSINATGEIATVHNFEVEGLHNYYVESGSCWLLVHNDEECVRLVYRSGSDSIDNLTPRPIKDEGGLSTFDTPEKAAPKGGKVQIIDTSRLQRTIAVPDSDDGHVSIRPRDGGSIPDWAETRGTGRTTPYTEDVRNAIIGERRVQKP